jgi:hypothetical protein
MLVDVVDGLEGTGMRNNRWHFDGVCLVFRLLECWSF